MASWTLLAQQAATAAAGFALQNATPTIISWTAPSDGNLHRVQIFASMSVGSAETGGTVSYEGTNPDGSTFVHTLFTGGNAGPGEVQPSAQLRIVKAGTTVSIVQTSALTSGAATVWAEIWGS